MQVERKFEGTEKLAGQGPHSHILMMGGGGGEYE